MSGQKLKLWNRDFRCEPEALRACLDSHDALLHPA